MLINFCHTFLFPDFRFSFFLNCQANTIESNLCCSIPKHFFSHICTIEREKAMTPHSSTLAWKIPWMEEPGGLQSMGVLRVGHDGATLLSLFTFMH